MVPRLRRQEGRADHFLAVRVRAQTRRTQSQVLSYFKRGGPGWQTRAVAALTKAAEHGE